MRKIDLAQIKFIWSKIKLDLIKITNLWSVKAHVSWMKRQTTEWGAVVANHIFHKEVVSRICDGLSKLGAKKKQFN